MALSTQSNVREVEAHFESRHLDWQVAYGDGESQATLFQARLDLAIRLCRRFASAPGAALDLGCGCGQGTLALARLGFESTGLDISESMVRRSRENAENAGLAKLCRFEAGDFSKIERPSRLFKVILALGFIEYFDDARGVLARIREWLADDGILVVQTPNRSRLAYFLQRRRGRHVERWPNGLEYRQLSPGELEALAGACGYEVCDYRGHNLGPIQIGTRFIPGYRASVRVQRGLDLVARRSWGRVLGRLGSSFMVALRKQ